MSPDRARGVSSGAGVSAAAAGESAPAAVAHGSVCAVNHATAKALAAPPRGPARTVISPWRAVRQLHKGRLDRAEQTC